MAINYQSPPDPDSFTHGQDGQAEAERYEANEREGKQTRNTGQEALMRDAMRNDAVQSVHAMFEQHGMPLHDAQFADVADEVIPWAESVTNRADYDEVLGQINPRDYVSQDNWRRGVGEGPIERHVSPRGRAQGRIAAAGAVFAANMPPLVPKPIVSRIQY